MDKFWELLKESVIVQAVLTIGLWGAVVYLVVIGQSIPDILSMGATTCLGFYFGSKLSLARGARV